MSTNNANANTQNGTSTAWQIIGRLITAGVVLAITAFFTPGFRINSFWALAAAAIVLTIRAGEESNPGYAGAGYTVSWMAAIIGALVYGVVDYLLPGDQQ